MKTKVVEYADKWTTGGIEGYILNLVKNIDHEKYEVSIVVAQKETTLYDDELKKYGVEVQSILKEVQTNPIKRILLNQRAFKNFMSTEKPDVLHLHICQGIAMRYAKIAKKIGIGRVITHCHNTKFGDGMRIIKSIGHKIGKKRYRKYADIKVACSDLAAKWLYIEKDLRDVQIKPYIVQIDKFRFSDERRNEVRKKYALGNSKVYLHIGRMHYQKNQKFLLDVYRKLIDIEPNSMLLFIGTGELEQEIKDYAGQLGLTQNIIFIQKTREVEKYMSASDVFLLPSLFEGNPIVGIEAQAAGLPCVFADTITRQAKILEQTAFYSLKEKPENWAKNIKEIKGYDGKYRMMCPEIAREYGYDVNKQIAEIEEIYK